MRETNSRIFKIFREIQYNSKIQKYTDVSEAPRIFQSSGNIHISFRTSSIVPYLKYMTNMLVYLKTFNANPVSHTPLITPESR